VLQVLKELKINQKGKKKIKHRIKRGKEEKKQNPR
jgi:hypothetical protein